MDDGQQTCVLRAADCACHAAHIAPGTPLQEIKHSLCVLLREHEHLRGHAMVVSYDDDMFASGDKDDGDEGDHWSIIKQDDEIVQQHVVQLMRSAPERAICVRHSAANGRIGLLLRRMPPLLFTITCQDSSVSIDSASLSGSAPIVPQQLLTNDEEPSTASSLEVQADLVSDRSEALVRRAGATAASWAVPLLWSLSKVYCCRDYQRERYEALVDDDDDWTKVIWAADDGTRILRAAADAASALASQQAGSRPCTVLVALECVFGSPCANASPAVASDNIRAVVPAMPMSEQPLEGAAVGDLRRVVVIGRVHT